MLRGFIVGLIIAWILSFFGVNTIILEAIQPFFTQVVLTDSHYYIAFGIAGLINGLFYRQ